jgi:NAD(P)-dependent dehydrogenase (short-subunit alcohol dehydrogenase family)
MSLPSHPLVGRVAVVTGGARGIGRAVAETLARHGLTVIVADAGLAIDGRPDDPDLAEKVAAELQGQGLTVLPYRNRLSTADDADRLVDWIEDQTGPVDILVNNAAILQDRMVFNLPPSSWDEVVQNNLSVPFYLLRRVAPSMRERRLGRIVNILSSAGLIGNYGQANYAAAKAGLFGLTRVAALDLARYTVTVNAVVPFAHTRVTDAIVPRHPAVVEYLATVKDRASPAHVAAVVAYLCSEAAAVLTGQTLGVRGPEVFVFSPPRPAGAVRAAGPLSPDVLDQAVRRWEAEGLLTPLETDLMVMSKPLSDPSTF